MGELINHKIFLVLLWFRVFRSSHKKWQQVAELYDPGEHFSDGGLDKTEVRVFYDEIL